MITHASALFPPVPLTVLGPRPIFTNLPTCPSRKDVEELRRQRRDELNAEIVGWMEETMRQAEQLVTKYNKTPRQMLDILYNPNIIRPKTNRTNPYVAWSWKIGKKLKENRGTNVDENDDIERTNVPGKWASFSTVAVILTV